jgi:hypothetical protein
MFLALAGSALFVPEPEPVRVYSFIGGWAVDERFPMLDPRHWGAKLDGQTDDRAALQRMLQNVGAIIDPPGRSARIIRTVLPHVETIAVVLAGNDRSPAIIQDCHVTWNHSCELVEQVA